jgi:hypothetical protein
MRMEECILSPDLSAYLQGKVQPSPPSTTSTSREGPSHATNGSRLAGNLFGFTLYRSQNSA